jgi:hypothetical protein
MSIFSGHSRTANPPMKMQSIRLHEKLLTQRHYHIVESIIMSYHASSLSPLKSYSIIIVVVYSTPRAVRVISSLYFSLLSTDFNFESINLNFQLSMYPH